MKKLASLIVAATAALACGQSFALAPNATPELTVTLSGASAQDAGLIKLIESKCAAGTIDYFSDTGAPIAANYNAYSCSVPVANLTLPAGVAAKGNLSARDTNGDGFVDVIVYKRSAGGSGEGPNGVCGDLSVTAQLVVNDAVCSDAGSTAPEVAGDKHWKCTGGNSQRQSNGGLTDLEYSKLPTPYNSVCASKTIVSQPIWGTIFNTPVSLNFRNALQCAQGLNVGSETEADMPSLPKNVVASVYNGGIANWNTLRAQDATGTYTTLALAVASKVAAGQCPGYDTAAFPIPTDTRVRACRRVSSSGTNAQFRVKFLNAVCSSEAQDQALDNTPNSNNSTNTTANWQNVTPPIASQAAMIEANSGSNMNSCISAFADATTPANQRWAIGLQSLENNVARTDRYRFIKIDGAAPTVANVLQQKYFDWVESNWIWVAADGSSTQDQKDAIDFQEILQKGTGEAAGVGALVNGSFIHSFGASGLVALNTVPGNVPSLPISAANPVATASHGGSSCRTPQVKVNTSF